MKLSTAITRLLSIDHPVLLAPMGGVSGGALAGAVSAAGGLGLIGAGYADPSLGWGSDDWIAGEFDKAGNHPVGIGFITWALDKRPGALDAALERRPAAVMLSFGDIAPYAAKIRDAGATLICQVQTLKDAARSRRRAPRSSSPRARKPAATAPTGRPCHWSRRSRMRWRLSRSRRRAASPTGAGSPRR